MKNIILVLISVFSINAFALGSMKFVCGGIEKVGNEKYEPINFSVVYSDWEDVQGYTYQAVEMDRGDKTDIIMLNELREVAQKNPSCSTLNEMKLHQTNAGFEYYEFSFTYNCEESVSAQLKTVGYCSKQ